MINITIQPQRFTAMVFKKHSPLTEVFNSIIAERFQVFVSLSSIYWLSLPRLSYSTMKISRGRVMLTHINKMSDFCYLSLYAPESVPIYFNPANMSAFSGLFLTLFVFYIVSICIFTIEYLFILTGSLQILNIIFRLVLVFLIRNYLQANYDFVWEK